MRSVLLVRLDSDGDVLLAGPAVRAAAAGADRVVLLVGPRGRAAAALLPGVDEIVVWSCPWVDADPARVDRADLLGIAGRLAEAGPFERAVVLTSFHQSPLPTAMLLRMAGVPWIGATCEDYPGSLLDLRHRLPDRGLHEVQRSLSLLGAAGFPSPSDHRLRVTVPAVPRNGVVVVHPGASVPARAPSPSWARTLVATLAARGHDVVVTGGPGEVQLTAAVAGDHARDLGGTTDLRGLATVLAGAGAVVVGNTGPAHLAAALGTPVVSLFSPVVPAERWRPWQVPHVLLGDQVAACAGSRARQCPLPGHPCLEGVPVPAAVDAVEALLAVPAQVAVPV